MEYTTIDTATVPATVNQQIEELGKEAFPKALASAIMAEFPVASIIAIFMAIKSQKVVKSAYDLAERNGVKVDGKCMAAKILSMVGKILGIVMTCFWGFYGIWLILYIAIMVIAGIASNM